MVIGDSLFDGDWVSMPLARFRQLVKSRVAYLESRGAVVLEELRAKLREIPPEVGAVSDPDAFVSLIGKAQGHSAVIEAMAAMQQAAIEVARESARTPSMVAYSVRDNPGLQVVLDIRGRVDAVVEIREEALRLSAFLDPHVSIYRGRRTEDDAVHLSLAEYTYLTRSNEDLRVAPSGVRPASESAL